MLTEEEDLKLREEIAAMSPEQLHEALEDAGISQDEMNQAAIDKFARELNLLAVFGHAIGVAFIATAIPVPKDGEVGNPITVAQYLEDGRGKLPLLSLSRDVVEKLEQSLE